MKTVLQALLSLLQCRRLFKMASPCPPLNGFAFAIHGFAFTTAAWFLHSLVVIKFLIFFNGVFGFNVFWLVFHGCFRWLTAIVFQSYHASVRYLNWSYLICLHAVLKRSWSIWFFRWLTDNNVMVHPFGYCEYIPWGWIPPRTSARLIVSRHCHMYANNHFNSQQPDTFSLFGTMKTFLQALLISLAMSTIV